MLMKNQTIQLKQESAVTHSPLISVPPTGDHWDRRALTLPRALPVQPVRAWSKAVVGV